MSCEESDSETVDPADDPRNEWVGEWQCIDMVKKQTYTVVIENDPSRSDQIILVNFGNLGLYPPDDARPFGILNDANDVVSVPSQYVCEDNYYQVEGIGIMTDENTIYWEPYYVDNLNMTATFTRK